MKVAILMTLVVFTTVATAQDTQRDSLKGFTSKYDFVSGAKILSVEDFSNTELGDFPPQWNTNATAEVVAVNGRPGRWMKINKEGVFHPEFIKQLPENFTLEFNLGVNEGWNSMPFIVNITNLKKPEEFSDYYHFVTWKGVPTIHLEFQPHLTDQGRFGSSKFIAGKDGNHRIHNDVEFSAWNNSDRNFAHVALWRQGQRLRVYLNGEKIWDIQKAFEPGVVYNAITLAMQGSYKLDDYYVLSNLKLAAGNPDTRNKLLREGKLVSSGILFNPGSDEIRPESYGVLKEIGSVLKDSLVQTQIVGHTDSDGDAALNLNLSKKRAEAVKQHLVRQFGIPADSLLTDGMGASMPVDKNNSLTGKANNRRVEFISVPITVRQGGPKPKAGAPKLPITVKPKNK